MIIVVKLRSACGGAAKWSIRATNHITRNDRHNQQFHGREDDRIQCYSRGDDGIWYDPRKNDGRWWLSMIWLSSVEFQFVIKGAIIRLNWSFSFMVAK